MRTKVQRWGNSLAVRIPRSFAQEAHLQENNPVELRVIDGRIVITQVSPPKVTLDDLLARITDENIHREIPVGPSMGTEAW